MTNPNLQKLETAIREALPELMELSEGCELLIRDDNEPVRYMGHIGEEKETMFLIDEDGEPEFLLDDGEIDKVDIKIIGHPVTILHLLRWLDRINDKHSFQYSVTDTSLYTTKPFKTYKLDLSKPHISQQSDEVIDNLVKLVK